MTKEQILGKIEAIDGVNEFDLDSLEDVEMLMFELTNNHEDIPFDVNFIRTSSSEVFLQAIYYSDKLGRDIIISHDFWSQGTKEELAESIVEMLKEIEEINKLIF